MNFAGRVLEFRGRFTVSAALSSDISLDRSMLALLFVLATTIASAKVEQIGALTEASVANAIRSALDTGGLRVVGS